MANASGTITNAQGWVTIDASLNDTITFTPTGGSYTVEYPARTTAISASSSTQTLSVAAGGQVRMLCISGSLAWARTDNNDGGPLDTSERAAVRALVSVDGILDVGGRALIYDGDAIPDPRRRAGVFGQFATQSSSSGYIDPEYTRRIVVTQDISATTSGVTASGGQDLTLFATAAAAGFRWDEPNRPFRSCLSQANNSLAVITIREA